MMHSKQITEQANNQAELLHRINSREKQLTYYLGRRGRRGGIPDEEN